MENSVVRDARIEKDVSYCGNFNVIGLHNLIGSGLRLWAFRLEHI